MIAICVFNYKYIEKKIWRKKYADNKLYFDESEEIP